ncbi:hypothetical protein CCOS865_03254 [Pseudomonas reidholzensis]|uniref:Uncharacterized protein n=1 Tax=Pseudomonas reidholzensis TaxID=1785162 RepID=A0A383RVQ3_9PSED|nr:hypothetical protein [Pseudomonas reidholzensis]SYX90985.1 hypothetical protein CCOS865_03254 [Pseudomonas reidholzensis]
MPPPNNTVEIRTLEELSSLYEIASGCTLTKGQYRNPLRPYRLIRPEASCQYQKNGKRCSQLHQHGFVVELHDDSKVLIGNCCALNHLGLDDEQVRGEFKKLSATERQNIRRHKVEAMLKHREDLIGRVRAASIKFRALHSKASLILTTLPTAVGGALLDRWKRNALEVSWEYLLIKKGKDEKGRPYEERSWYAHSFGMFKGLGVWQQLDQQLYLETLLKLRRQLEAIPVKARLSQLELEHAEAALSQVATLETIERQLQGQIELLDDFRKPSNLQLVIQIVSNQKVRAETVTAVYHLMGEPCSMTPEKYVAEIDLALKKKYAANGIRIAS